MKLSKTQQMLLLGVGAVTVAGVAIYLLTRGAPVGCVEGTTRCNGLVSEICEGGVWVAGGGLDCSAKGQLRVTTDPPADLDISVDGVFVDSWGVDWVKFSPGPHVLHFDNPRGAVAVVPADYTFTIVVGYTTILIADTNTGTVTASSQPCLTPGCVGG